MNVIKPRLLYQLGSVQLYYYGETFDGVPTNIHWQCLKANIGRGPFINIYFALSHLCNYGNVALDFKASDAVQIPETTQDNNVITVDFRNKKRSGETVKPPNGAS